MLAGFVVAAETIDLPTIRVAVNQQGHMRLLSSELEGSFNAEPRSNEFVIELLSDEGSLCSAGATQCSAGED